VSGTRDNLRALADLDERHRLANEWRHQAEDCRTPWIAQKIGDLATLLDVHRPGDPSPQALIAEVEDLIAADERINGDPLGEGRPDDQSPYEAEWIDPDPGSEELPASEQPPPDSLPPPPAPLREAAFHGLAGKFVKLVGPRTEADPAATLVQFLLAFGNACGRGPGFQVESDVHGTNEFVAIVGKTGRAGRKGSAWGHVRRIMELADIEWAKHCIRSGIASGEGLIHAVRDPLVVRRKARTKEERDRADEDGRIEEEVDPGVDEKRLLVVQGELAQVLRVMQREGNTVSPILRDLWDHGNAGGLAKHQPEQTTGSMVSVIGHITPREQSRELTEVEAANGFGNRWLWVFARRSKRLPRGGHVDEDAMVELANEINKSLRFARDQGMLGMTDDAWNAWELFYDGLDDQADDLLAAVTARAESHVRRLAVIYALLACQPVVGVEHLRAAIAVWDYCEASAAHLFGGKVGDPLADRILDAVRTAGDQGLTRTGIRELVGGKVTAKEIDAALRYLLARGLVVEKRIETPGRPAHAYHAPKVEQSA
jgi:hypothetical protein